MSTNQVRAEWELEPELGSDCTAEGEVEDLASESLMLVLGDASSGDDGLEFELSKAA